MKSANLNESSRLIGMVTAFVLVSFFHLAATALASPRPDLVVTYLGLTQASLVVGQPITIKCFVTNRGNAAAGPSVLNIGIGGDPTPHRFNVPRLAPGQKSPTFEIVGHTFKGPGKFGITAMADFGDRIRESNENNNQKYVVVEVTAPAKPDLAIYSIVPSKKYPVKGDYVHFTICVKNRIGAAMAPPSKLRVTIGSRTFTYDVPRLAPGRNFSIGAGITGTGTGRMRVTAKVDPDNRIAESDENNNEKSIMLVWEKENLPNLTITAVRVPHLRKPLNHSFHIKVTVKNTGRKESGPFYLSLTRPCDNAPGLACGYEPFEKIYLPSLAPKRSLTHTFTFKYHWRTGKKVVRIEVDPDNRIHETREGDNSRRVTIQVTLI